MDNFAGGGGASTGIEMALGRSVDIAINHDAEAVEMHKANHPQTQHYCEDVFQINPIRITNGRPVGIAWFSPDCKHFSKAKGGRPRSKKIRGLAWVMLRWAATVRPRVMVLENVEEFQTWGPLLPDGQPCAKRKGKTFFSFIFQLRELGYEVEWRELRACDYGAPTIRKRLFLIARCDGRKIAWAEPSHGSPISEGVRKKRLKPWRTAAECIDWTLPCPSIFERKKPLVEATLRRIARGLRRFVVEAENPFIIPSFLTECAGVKGGHFALVSAFLAKHYTDQGQRPGAEVTEPLSTITARDHHSLIAVNLIRHFGQSTGQKISQPVPTVVANGGGKTGVMATYIMKMKGDNMGHAADDPMHTITSGGMHFAEVRAFLIKYYGNEKEGVGLREPMHTVTAKDRLGLVVVRGENYFIADIGMRMLQPHELYAAQGFPENYIIAPIIKGRPLGKVAQVRMCGNSVCPPVAQAIVAANVPEMGVMAT